MQLTQTSTEAARPAAAVPASTGGRMIQLDVLRGIAILLVFCRHPVLPWSAAGPLQPVVRCLYHLGWTGVDLFFVLSGFLIGGLLFHEIKHTGRLDVSRFLIRRGLKIWPAYLVYIAYVFVLLWAGQHQSFRSTLARVGPNLLHLQNYVPAPGGMPCGHTWSLAVEEHFYLVLPLALVLLLAAGGGRRLPRFAIPLIAAGLIGLCTAMRYLVNPHQPFDWFHVIAPTHMRVDGLFFGVFLAYAYHLHPRAFARVASHRWLLLITGLLLICPMAVLDQGDAPVVWTLGVTVLYLGYGCILVAVVHTPPSAGLLGRAIHSRPAAVVAWVGVFSYSIYLWHMEPNTFIESRIAARHPTHHLSLYWFVGTGIFFAAAVALGVLMSKLVEMPVLALRERLVPRRDRAVPFPPPDATTERVVERELGPLAMAPAER